MSEATSAVASGVTFTGLCERLSSHEPRVLWLVLRDELTLGRVECVDGHYCIRPDAFDAEVFQSLRQLAHGNEVYE